MRQIKTWVQLYVDWITRIGIIRFSLLLAFCIISIAVVIQGTITLLLRGVVDIVDLVRSVFFWFAGNTLGCLFPHGRH